MWRHRLTLRLVRKRKEGRSWREARVTAGECEPTQPFRKVAPLTRRRPPRPAGRSAQGPGNGACDTRPAISQRDGSSGATPPTLSEGGGGARLAVLNQRGSLSDPPPLSRCATGNRSSAAVRRDRSANKRLPGIPRARQAVILISPAGSIWLRLLHPPRIRRKRALY